MKRRKRMPFRSAFFWSAAGRAAASIAENTIAPLIERLGKTVPRKAHSTAAGRHRRGLSLDEITRQQAQDEQDMFDAQMASLPRDSSNGHALSRVGTQPKEQVEDATTSPAKLVAVLNRFPDADTKRVESEKAEDASARTLINAGKLHDAVDSDVR